MKARIERIQSLFKERFSIELKENELYGNLAPRLIKQMDKFLEDEISDTETIKLTSYLAEKLYGKAILNPAPPNKVNDLEDSLTNSEVQKQVEKAIKNKDKLPKVRSKS